MSLREPEFAASCMERPVLVFHCDGGSLAEPDAPPAVPGTTWIRVPCIGRVSEGDLLRALRSGAAAVILAGCEHDRCRFHSGDERAEEVVARVQSVIARLGWSPHRVAVVRAGGTFAVERAVSLAMDAFCAEFSPGGDTHWMRRAMPARAHWPHHGAIQEAALLGHVRADRGVSTPGWAVHAPRPVAGVDLLYVCDAPTLDPLLGEPYGVDTLAVQMAALKLLRAVGLNPAVADTLPGCGHDHALAGDRPALVRLAAQTRDALGALDPGRVITLCPECERTLRDDYPRLGAPVAADVTGVLGLLYERRQQLEQVPGLAVPVAVYVDVAPDTEEQQERAMELLTRAGYEVVARLPDPYAEPGSQGSAGVTGFVECDQAARAAQERLLRVAVDAGAARLLALSPLSAVHLGCARRRGSWRQSRLQVSTVYEALAERLP